MQVWHGMALLAAAGLLAGCARPSMPMPGPRDVGARPSVVSLNPCTDAILVAVADPAQVLAISHYSKDPRASSLAPDTAAPFPATRGSVEEVLALQPDLVLGSSYTDQATVRAYARAGLPLARFGAAGTVAESRAQVRRIAALVGHPERGEALVSRIDAALTRSAPPPASAPLPAILWQPGGLVAGQGTLVAELMTKAGLANPAATTGGVLSLEELLANPPPLLVLVDDATTTGAEQDRLRRHPAFAHLRGTRRETIDARLLFCGGPSIIPALDRLVQLRRAQMAGGGAA